MGTPTYNDGAGNGDLSFSGFANLQGGTNVDTFNVTAASAFNLLGGAGADVFNIGATLTGSVNGKAGSDTLQGTQITNVTLVSSNADGFTGTTAAVTTGFSGIDVITGNGTGTLTGENVASTWDLDGTPTYFDGTTSLAITGFTSLQGGANVDTFNVAPASYNLIGGAGADVFALNATLTGNIDGQANGGTLRARGGNATLTAAGTQAGYNGTTDARRSSAVCRISRRSTPTAGGTLTGFNGGERPGARARPTAAPTVGRRRP